MIKNWKPTKLAEVLTQVSRPEELDPTNEYRLLGVRLDGAGPFLRETITGSQSAATRLFKVQSGDFIYSRLFACRGAFGVITATLDGCYVSGEFPTFRCVSDRIDTEFLRLWFRLPSIVKKVEGDCSGSTPLTRNRFKENFFLDLEIPLPPLPEQQRIVARIEALTTQIKEARGLRQKVAVEQEALVISTHVKLSGKRTKLLGEIIELDEEQVAVLPNERYPQVGVKSFGGGLFAKPSLAGTETTYRVFNRLYDGALVLSQVKAWEGAIAICGNDLAGWYVSPEYRTFRCIPDESLPGYLSALVRTEWFWSKLIHATRGVGARRERTRPEQFLAIRISIPDVGHQKEGEELYRKVDALKELQAKTVTELDAILPSILDKAFKGEL